ncbi:25517_t:CDS:2 [Gigaspora margarita]|uniref:25517_t:CDS:1 n=1 Tax=Gigaspora margarita TaxID=4874 RepID=A0ABN7VSW4_GIGMA|nr:25517_t:CDS:2 [Gigaspora margarita]
MSTSTSQNEDIIVEITTEEKEPEDKDEKKSEDEKNKPKKYFAITDLEFELPMYDINKNSDDAGDSTLENNSEQKDGMKPESDPELGNDQELSYRKLYSIPTTFKFTDTQLNLIKDKHENIFSDYSMHDIDDKELLIKYGGIVKLFSEKDYVNNQKVEEVEQITNKNNQSADGNILIILTISGIYKYFIKNKSIKNIQKFKYPRRICNIFINYLNLFFGFFKYTLEDAYCYICSYIVLCLNKQYFLVDTFIEGIEYMELYDLKTNQLINTFQRQISRKSIIFDIWPNFAISDNNKLLAYLSIKKIKIYSIECGLEIMDIEVENIIYHGFFSEFIRFCFFHNDEILLMYYKDEWSVCNIFSSLRDSVKLEELEFIGKVKIIGTSKSFMVVYNGDKMIIYDDLFVNKYLKYLKRNTEQDWKKLSKEDLDNNIQESELDEYHNIFEPWRGLLKKEKILLIGNYSIQVWYDRGPEKGPKKRSLEFIYVPLSQLLVPQNAIFDIWECKTIKVMDIKYCNGKFNLNTQIKNIPIEQIKQIEEIVGSKMGNEDIERSLQIKQTKMEDEDYIVNVVKYAYLLDCIQLQDFRFDLMSEINTIRKAFSEYYSNNAINNLEWMNTVVDIVPELYEYKEENNGKEKAYDWSSISFDIWSFWPLAIISIIGSFMLVLILQNVIISFMSDAFLDAVKDCKRGVYRFQIDYIHEFALFEKSLELNKLDSKFKNKIRAKYICFQDDPQITNSWKEISEKIKSKPYPKIKLLNKSGFESWLIDDCKFIWKKDKKDVEYWFL